MASFKKHLVQLLDIYELQNMLSINTMNVIMA